jgi:hypothetical protein
VRSAGLPAAEGRPSSERQRGQKTSWRRFPWFTVLAVCAVCLSVGAFQIYRHAYSSNFADHPDESAHFVSGVCVLDYFRTALGTNPIQFVESYYVRYPKVALGHWPPMFYIIQAIWYGLLGPSAFQAILLAGAIAASTACAVFLRLKRLYGYAAAGLATAVLLWLPLVRASEIAVMSDMAGSLFILLSVFAFCDACVLKKRRYWLAAGGWTVIAVLTKESALILIAILPIALLGLYGKRLLAFKRLRLALLVGAAALLVLYLLYGASGILGVRGAPVVFSLSEAWRTLPLLAAFFSNASPVMFLIAAYAIFAWARAGASSSSDRGLYVLVAIIWLGGTLVSQLFFRDAFEPRYLLPAYLPLTILVADGFSRLQQNLRHSRGAGIAFLAILSLTVVTLVSTPQFKMRQRIGYSQVAAAIPNQAQGRVVLVSADEKGEGAMVAEMLIADPDRKDVILRGTKMLSTSDWMGRDYALLVKSAADVLQFLDSTPVNYVVVDMNGFIQDATRPHQRLLEETIRDHAEQFRLIADLPLYFDGHLRNHAVRVYENLAARGRQVQTVVIHMVATLGRDLRVQLKPPRRMAPRAEARIVGGLARPDVPPTEFSMAPASDSIPARGGTGYLYITAPPAYSWSLRDVPAWIRVRNATSTGDGIVTYEIDQNTTNVRRSAVMAVDKLAFSITQPRSATTYVPFSGAFGESVAPIWELSDPDLNSTVDPPSQWALDDQSRRGAKALLERGNGIQALVLDKPAPATESWKTRISLLRIGFLPGRQYRAVVSMKAENSAPVWLTLRRGAPPYEGCGLSEAVPVTRIWADFSVDFRVPETCNAGNDRFDLEAGKIVGRLWVANFRLTETH